MYYVMYYGFIMCPFFLVTLCAPAFLISIYNFYAWHHLFHKVRMSTLRLV